MGQILGTTLDDCRADFSHLEKLLELKVLSGKVAGSVLNRLSTGLLDS